MRSVGLRLIHVASIAMSIVVPAAAQDFSAGEPIGARSEAGEWRPMSDNVKVYGSFHFTESCTFDPGKTLILAMNAGNRTAPNDNDGYVSLIHPDGSVHTPSGSAPPGTAWSSTIRWAVPSVMVSSTRLIPGTYDSSTLRLAAPCERFPSPARRY